VLVVTYEVGERAKPPAGFLKLFKEAAEVRELKLARKDLTGWVVERARAKGVRVSGDAVAEAVGILGESPATLDSALDQLASAFPGEVVGAEQVRAQFRGLGEQRVWDLCDRMFARDLSASIHSLRSLLGSRDDPLAILGGIASRLRDLLRVKSVPERTPASEVARAAGLRYEWQARRYLEQARRFTLPELVEIHAQVAEADRQMKSGAPGELVLPVLVTRVSAGV
jgi:DNA polymerase-3 subunit delta